MCTCCGDPWQVEHLPQLPDVMPAQPFVALAPPAAKAAYHSKGGQVLLDAGRERELVALLFWRGRLLTRQVPKHADGHLALLAGALLGKVGLLLRTALCIVPLFVLRHFLPELAEIGVGVVV